MSQDRLHFVEVGNKNRQWEVYVSLFPIYLEPHRSNSRIEAITALEEEVSSLLKCIRQVKSKLKVKKEDTKIKIWVTEALWDDRWIIKQRELTYVKCKKTYKVFGDWGYTEKQYYRKSTIELNKWTVSGRPKIHRKLTKEKQDIDTIIKELQ